MSKHGMQRDRRAAQASEGDPQVAGYRHERLSRIFREEISALLRDEVTDPVLDGVAVTYVELSVDYKNARIGYAGPAGGETPREVRDRFERALARATPFLRSRLAESVDLKQVPVLRFAWDSLATAEPGEIG